MNELIDLKKKRNNLNLKIREMIWRDKESSQIKENVLEYLDITNKMIQMGANIKRPKVQQFDPKYWDTHTTFDFKGTKPIPQYSSQQIKEKTIIKEVYIEPKKSYYILNICWSEFKDNLIKENFDKYILPYLKFINIKYKENINDFDDHIEYIIKCKYNGYDEDFKLLKQTLEYLIQNNKLNIEIFGKKRN